MIDINDFESCAQGSRCYEKLRVVDDIDSCPLGVSADSCLAGAP